MFKQQAPKPFEFVGTAHTFKRFTLDHFQHYSYRASFCLSLVPATTQRPSSVPALLPFSSFRMSPELLKNLMVVTDKMQAARAAMAESSHQDVIFPQ